MKNRKGFTLIEVISVIIIIGIIMLIAVPNVTDYIFGSRRSSYATDIHAYIETVRAEYESREYGPLLRDNEIMLVPIQIVILEKGDSGRSPFGEYDYTKSYIVIVPEKGGYQFYANVVDKEKFGVINVSYSVLDRSSILDDATAIIPWGTYGKDSSTTFTYNEKDYAWCENRTSKNSKDDTIPILVLCEE